VDAAHLSAFAMPGMNRISNAAAAQFDDQLAFRKPNGEMLIIVRDQKAKPVNVAVAVGELLLRSTTAAGSYNTVVIQCLTCHGTFIQP
jgi:glucosylceramidase